LPFASNKKGGGVMGKRVLLAIALMLMGGMAFAAHAVAPEPDTNSAAVPAPAPAPEAATVPTVAPPPQVQVTLPSALDVYLVPAATREVCTTSDWGYGEIRTDCRTEALPVRPDDPALRGICTTYYGRRTCY
jgi:hypothetical protein